MSRPNHLKGARGQAPKAHRPVSAPRTQAPRPKPAPHWQVAQWLPAVQATVARCGLTLGDDQVQQLVRYMGLLQEWNATYNLTALRDPVDMLTHHLADCLVVVPVLQKALAERGWLAGEQAVRVLDVGSGGGLPGVVLAICCPEVQVTCVDTVGKKAAFIRQVAAELALPITRGVHRLKAEHNRVELLKGEYPVITSRAFASLVDFTAWTQHLLPAEGVWMAMKGVPPDAEEQAALQPVAHVFHVEQLQVPGLDDAQRCIVWMRRGAV
jgi:16S rRNA (guanine527-N7)-methyltransferase